MKLKIIIVLFLSFLSITIFGQNLRHTIYLRGPQYLIPESDFGIATAHNNYGSIEKMGVGMAVGGIFYIDTDENLDFITPAIDFTFAELCALNNEVKAQDFAINGTTKTNAAVLFGMKMGPLIAINLGGSTFLDVFGQGHFCVSEYNVDLPGSNLSPISNINTNFRVNAGASFGHDKYFVTVAYNYGRPTIKQIDNSSGQEELVSYKLHGSYIKIAATIKFTPTKSISTE
jgi:hypothetical protein